MTLAALGGQGRRVGNPAFNSSTKEKLTNGYPRLKELYKSEIVSAGSELAIDNINKAPRLEKIVVNMGVGEAAFDSKQLDAAMNDMRIITGQQPCVTRAKKSTQASTSARARLSYWGRYFAWRPHVEFPIACCFMASPRVCDFRGISPKSFSTAVATNLGITEQLIFLRLNDDKIDLVPAAWTSPLSPLPKTTNRPRLFLDALGFPRSSK